MKYAFSAISDAQVPRAFDPTSQPILDTYASETNKVISVWGGFAYADLPFRPQAKSSTVLDIMKHQLLSERRFFGEFLGLPKVEASAILPTELSVARLRDRMFQLAFPGLAFLAELAARVAHRTSPDAVDGIPATARQARPGYLRSDRGCDLGRGTPDPDRRSGGPERFGIVPG